MSRRSFSPAADEYFAAHGIAPEIARILFRPDDDGFAIPYSDGEGSIQFCRRRDLEAGKTLQPPGVSLDLYMPIECGTRLLACEGESDTAAAITAMFEPDEFGTDVVRRKDLPPPLADLTPVALPGAGVCHGRLADLMEETGAQAFVALDADDAGRAGAAKLAAKIPDAVLIDLPDGKDLSDVLAGADDPVEALANLVAEAEAREESEQSEVSQQSLRLSSHPSLNSQPQPPTKLHDDAFYGLAGEVVEAIDPHTEADPAAILVQLLAAVGNAVGRGPGFRVEADEHHCNLFVVIVGPSAVARKGSSFGQAKRLAVEADPSWESRIVTGSSSGEGLIWLVRDAIEEVRAAGDDDLDAVDGFVTEISDIGVEDKRALVIEPEFASVLERMNRDGNTLSAVLRQAWDGQMLDTLVKSNRAKATGAHISVIGHITVAELQRKLNATEAANGFANRFLWIYATRSKSLPFGGDLDSVDWAPYVARLSDAITYANTGSQGFTEDARDLWVQVYPALTDPGDGMLGAVTARAAAQVRRLAVIYSVLDPKPDGGAIVTGEHLKAALALWNYSVESAAFIFGESLGDPTADSILARLKANPEGMTRKDISNAFGRHQSAADLDRALAALAQRGLAFSVTEKTGGRPAERWLAGGEQSEQSEQRPPGDGLNSLSSLNSHPREAK